MSCFAEWMMMRMERLHICLHCWNVCWISHSLLWDLTCKEVGILILTWFFLFSIRVTGFGKTAAKTKDLYEDFWRFGLDKYGVLILWTRRLRTRAIGLDTLEVLFADHFYIALHVRRLLCLSLLPNNMISFAWCADRACFCRKNFSVTLWQVRWF